MTKQTRKNWRNRIIISIMCSLVLVMTSPQIIGYTLTSVTTQQNVISMQITNSHTAYASDDKSTETLKDDLMSIHKILKIQSFLSQAIWPILYMIGGLMDNNLLFGGGMGKTLQSIWIPIRNIVNILFVIILVGIALYNITGLGEDKGNYSIKTIVKHQLFNKTIANHSILLWH